MQRTESSDKGQDNRNNQINVGQDNRNGINSLVNHKGWQKGPMPNVKNIRPTVVSVLIKANIDNPAIPTLPHRGQDGKLNPQLNPSQFAEEVQQQLGPNGGDIISVYRKPHSE